MKRIHKGDTVQIMKGKNRGKTGKVLRVDVGREKIVIEGLNVFKKHVRPKREGEKGEIVEVSRPVAAASVLLFCSACERGVRAGFRVDGNSKNKVRYCRKCQRTL